ncbi:GNAT family N-acetyltransferase [Roseibium aestuarii]|uniref:GNAT family N-acetyltransferase n=1 Tax=Roseibium aestuarii TaxID=2600299 RepID=A0ABW4JWA8_9HYPH
MDDLIRDLGYTALGTRLKRIGDILQTQTQVILNAQCPDAPPSSHHAILMALLRHGPLSIGSLALALRQSQPGVSRMTSKLLALGLVEKQPDPQDQRISRMALTDAGQTMAEGLNAGAWQQVNRAVADAVSEGEGDLLTRLARLEDALEALPLSQRPKIAAPQETAAHPLDAPVWQALVSRLDRLALGGRLARRFDPQVSPFAASLDDTSEALAALAALVSSHHPEDRIFLMQARPCTVPAGLETELTAEGVQMVKTRPAEGLPPCENEILPLSAADAPEMLALAELTKPGPFRLRTPEMGRFWGVRIDGRLAAMAGQRLSLPGFTEISGVCTHPDFRGRGLAASLSDFVAQRILERGDTPFLHAWADNDGAIRLYRRLGFDLRASMHVAVLRRAQGPQLSATGSVSGP